MRHWMVLLALTTSLLYGEGRIVWEKDIDKAFAASAEEKKPLLLFFTGSDCSGWGMKMKSELLSSSDFIEKTQGHFIFAEIDFPEHKTQAGEQAAKNLALKEKWKVTQIPRLIVVDAEGREIGRFGSTSLSPKEFGEDLLALLKKDGDLSQQLDEVPHLTLAKLEDLYKLAKELERPEAIETILEAGCERGAHFFLLEKYRRMVEEGKGEEKKALSLRAELLSSDPQNEKKIHFSIALIDFQRLSHERPANPFLTIRPLEDYLRRFGESDKENKWRLEMMVAQFYLDRDEWRVALRHAESALASAPDTKKEEIARSVTSIRSEAALAGK